MRLFVVSAVVAALAAPAAACPPLEACVVRLPSTVRAVPSADRDVSPAVAAMIRHPLLVPKRLQPGEIELPWIWRVLKEQVYSQLPTYEEKHEFKLVLAPVVVTTPVDTIPGIGVEGDF